jgi:GTPase SAR1 family protein
VKLPRIVVVGDQSAGKSSVLESFTGTPFPRDSGACTRFATEIRLRRSKQSRFLVHISPDLERPQSEIDNLLAFASNVSPDKPFDALMREAVEIITPSGPNSTFAAKDILIVEKSGPQLPFLTVVDLPGLVRIATKEKAEADVKAIEELTDKYMKSSRSLLLAVVGGNNEYDQALILDKAKKFDPNGERTIGVLTKPDLTKKIGREDAFIDLVNNKDEKHQFKLGWFVLLNPGVDEDGNTLWWNPEERKREEEKFFSQGKWSALPKPMVGALALAKKLSVQLSNHIASYVPKLCEEIEEQLGICEAELKQLGEGKDTEKEMRDEMGELALASRDLVKEGVSGNYENPPKKEFFKLYDQSGTPRSKLRARAVEANRAFARKLHDESQKLYFTSKLTGSSIPYISHLLKLGSLSKSDYAMKVVEPLIKQNHGTQFFEDHEPRLIYALFRGFSQQWARIAQDHKNEISKICKEFLAEVIVSEWHVHMRDSLRSLYIDPKLNAILDDASKTLERLLSERSFQVQSYDLEYEERYNAFIEEATKDGKTIHRAERLLEQTLIYYDVSDDIWFKVLRNHYNQVFESFVINYVLDRGEEFQQERYRPGCGNASSPRPAPDLPSWRVLRHE